VRPVLHDHAGNLKNPVLPASVSRDRAVPRWRTAGWTRRKPGRRSPPQLDQTPVHGRSNSAIVNDGWQLTRRAPRDGYLSLNSVAENTTSAKHSFSTQEDNAGPIRPARPPVLWCSPRAPKGLFFAGSSRLTAQPTQATAVLFQLMNAPPGQTAGAGQRGRSVAGAGEEARRPSRHATVAGGGRLVPSSSQARPDGSDASFFSARFVLRPRCFPVVVPFGGLQRGPQTPKESTR